MSKRKSTKIVRKCKKCGKKMLVLPSDVERGRSKFCSIACCAAHRVTHGLSKHPLYGVWSAMVQRCGNANNADYRNYGGRGIAVCEEWKASFVAFHAWAITGGWKKGLEIDREKNDEGYSPSNCRVVTHRKNLCNTRKREGMSSKYRGVSCRGQTGKWRAKYTSRHLGYFTVEKDAALAWDKEAIAQGRDNHILNFPLTANRGRSRPQPRKKTK